MRQQQVRNLDVVHWQGLEDSLQALLLLQHLCLAARQHVRLLQHLFVAVLQSPAWQQNRVACRMHLCSCCPQNIKDNQTLSGSVPGRKAGAPAAPAPLSCSKTQSRVGGSCARCEVRGRHIARPSTISHQHLFVQWLRIWPQQQQTQWLSHTDSRHLPNSVQTSTLAPGCGTCSFCVTQVPSTGAHRQGSWD